MRKTRHSPAQQDSAVARRRALLCACALVCGHAAAAEFTLDNGLEGQWGLGMSVGTSVRTGNADAALIQVGNGGTANSSHDDGNTNFQKHDPFSTIGKVTGELELKKGGFGGFVRAKAWYDYTLMTHGVPHGSSANGYVAGDRLNDEDYDRLSRFSGASLLDAYGFWSGDLGEGQALSLKLGRHVVNWGESLFIQGINQFGAVDVSASRRPGAELKEVLLPVNQLSANLGLGDGLSLEGFYQLGKAKNVLDGCGTYWSISDVYNCSDNGVVVPAGPFALRTDGTNYASTPNLIMGNGGNRDPKTAGQYGLAAHYYAQGLDTEFGAYYVNYNQRSPILSVLFNGSPTGSVFAAGNNRLEYVWDWSAKNIKVFGLSASTNLAGWSVSGEASYTKDIPVQINGVDLLRGASSGLGPLAWTQAIARNQGTLLTGYELKNKTQVQASMIKVFPRVAGTESVSLVGEGAFQHWNGIGDPSTGVRYGRAFVYGQAQTSTLPCASTGNLNTSYCETEGYATTNAWGYRLRAEFSYPGLFAGINVKPRVFWSHDVKGYSADSTFVEDRMALGLGVRFDYLNRYYADLSFNKFNRQAKYDVFHDRDFASVVVGMNF
jgi:hypothetical protein